ACNSEVRRNPDRTFEQITHYRFDKFTIGPIEPTKLHISYVVTQEGHLVRMSITGSAKPELDGEIKGMVEDGMLHMTAVFRSPVFRIAGLDELKPEIPP